MRLTRRQFVGVSAAAGAGLLIGPQLLSRFARGETSRIPLPGSAIPQFMDPLPRLDIAGGTIQTLVSAGAPLEIHAREFRSMILPSGFVLPNAQRYRGTWVWGYIGGAAAPVGVRDTFTGPVVVSTRGVPTEIKYVNSLGDATTSRVRFWKDATDQTLHWADPLGTGHNMDHYAGPIPVVPHLHGGEVPPVIDGGPDAWYTSDGRYRGHAYYTKPTKGKKAPLNQAIYRYPNTQEAAPLWFHDHVLGATRLNVYAGLAGAYPLIDPDLSLPTGLHPVGLQQGADSAVDPLIPLVIQDRMFDTSGELFFPSVGINPEHPYWLPEFEGDAICVNGKTWPYLEVEPRRYRFLFINGSNARTYEMFIMSPATKTYGPTMWQIATDGGYLDAPVEIGADAPGGLSKLVLMPGERADVIVDFAGLDGQRLVLRNIGRTPFPKGPPPSGATLGRILQFRVGPGPVPDTSYDPASGTPLRPPMVRLAHPSIGTLAPGLSADVVRQLTLNEVMGLGGPLEVLVNNTHWSGLHMMGGMPREDFVPVTIDGVTEYHSEVPTEGTLELWEIVNITADAHPIHTHLTQFQLVNRQAFNVPGYNAAYAAAFPGSDMVDLMSGMSYPPGMYIPGFGPPLDYRTGNARALGGNPDVVPFLLGSPRPPAANEAGWKDTTIMFPGDVTRIALRYAPLDTPAGVSGAYPFDPNAGGHGYVWHCHIIDHEDNEMMRPYSVKPKAVPRSYVLATDY